MDTVTAWLAQNTAECARSESSPAKDLYDDYRRTAVHGPGGYHAVLGLHGWSAAMTALGHPSVNVRRANPEPGVKGEVLRCRHGVRLR